MKNYPTKPLGEVAEFLNGRAFKPSEWSERGVPIIRIQNLTNPLAPANRFEGKIDKRNAVTKGDLLVSWSATLDAFIWDREDAVLNQHIFRVVPDFSKVTKLYLFHAIRSVMDELRSQTHGATMKHITKGPFERTEIPVPPLPEQAQIVKLLDEADALRKLRAKADTRTAALMPALFDEMFGDLESGRWPVSKMVDICEVKGGKRLPKGEEYSEIPTPYRYIRVTNIQEGQIDEGALLYLKPETQSLISRYTVKEGDLVITIAGTIGTIAPVTKTLSGANLTENAAKLVRRSRDSYDTVFLSELMQTPFVQNQIGLRTGQVTIGKLALFRIEQLSLPLPPLPLQKEFAARVTELRVLEAAQASSRARLEELFQSMLSKAFRGEL